MAAEHVGVAGCDGVWQGDRVWQVGSLQWIYAC